MNMLILHPHLLSLPVQKQIHLQFTVKDELNDSWNTKKMKKSVIMDKNALQSTSLKTFMECGIQGRTLPSLLK